MMEKNHRSVLYRKSVVIPWYQNTVVLSLIVFQSMIGYYHSFYGLLMCKYKYM